MRTNIIIGLMVIGIVILSGCAQQQKTKYVCPDGTTVSDASICPSYCGDNECNLGEDCKSCLSDCGKCFEDLTCEEAQAKYGEEYCGNNYCDIALEEEDGPCPCPEDCLF